MTDQFVIFVGDGAWRIARVHERSAHVARVALPADAALDGRAAAVKQQLAELGYAYQPVLLAVASSWCLATTISTEDLERGGRRRAMAFRMEEQLPISAEEFVADYIPGSRGQALGVCAELQKLEAIVSALQAAGIDVRHICPAALLATAYAVDPHADVAAVLTVGRGNDAAEGSAQAEYDLVELQKGKPVRWSWLAEDGAAVTERLAAWAAATDPPAPLAVIGGAAFSADTWQAPNDIVRMDISASTLSLAGGEPGTAPGEAPGAGEDPAAQFAADQAAALHGARILEGAAAPWIDLRTDALAPPDRHHATRKPVAALVAAALAVLVSVSVVAQWRGRRYEALARSAVQQQTEVFKAAFPNQRVPGDVKGRLLSEQQKLSALCGQAADDAGAGVLKSPSALDHLRTVLSSTPTDLRYRILDLSIQPDLIRIDGQARSHSEAERVATALRQSGAYEVEAPKTQALKVAGVSFLFTAKPHDGAATPQGDAR
jgi:type II secretory pathway component PulL